MVRKYRNTPTVVEGIKFPSKGEARRYCELKLLERAGAIYDLKRQVLFRLTGLNGSTVGRYTVDFAYTENSQKVAEDFKGYAARDMPMRIALFRDNFPEIELRIVR
jgi:hypothetical protein